MYVTDLGFNGNIQSNIMVSPSTQVTRIEYSETEWATFSEAMKRLFDHKYVILDEKDNRHTLSDWLEKHHLTAFFSKHVLELLRCEAAKVSFRLPPNVYGEKKAATKLYLVLAQSHIEVILKQFISRLEHFVAQTRTQLVPFKHQADKQCMICLCEGDNSTVESLMTIPHEDGHACTAHIHMFCLIGVLFHGPPNCPYCRGKVDPGLTCL